MIHEILNTSAPSGLKPGSSGYCTVKSSRGIPGPTMDLLESLSGYRHVFTPGSAEAARNPVNWGHYLVRIGGRMAHVLSRVSDCPLDYTGRSNKLAHHMVVDGATGPAGPAWLLGRPGWMIDKWDGRVEQFATSRVPPHQVRQAGRCAEWERVTGSQEGAGWAGVMAESFLADPDRKVFLIYPPGVNALALFEEALALLPDNRRWDVTFATYGASLPKTVDYLWSGIVAGSTEVQQSQRFVNALRIDLTALTPPPPGGTLVQTARTGVVVKRPTAPPLLDRNRSGIPLPGPPAPPTPGVPRPVAVDRPNYAPQYSAEEALPPSLPLSHRTRSDFPWALVGGVVAGVLVLCIAVAVFVFSKKTNPDQRMANATPANPPGSSSVSTQENRVRPGPPRNGDGRPGQDTGGSSSDGNPLLRRGDDRSQTDGGSGDMPNEPKVQPESPSTDPLPTTPPPPATTPPAPPPNPPVSPVEVAPKTPTATILLAAEKSTIKGKAPVVINFSDGGDGKLETVTRATLMIPFLKVPKSSTLHDSSHSFANGVYSIAETRPGGSEPYIDIEIASSVGRPKVTLNPLRPIHEPDKTCLEHAVLWIEGDNSSQIHLQLAPPLNVETGLSIENMHVRFDPSKFKGSAAAMKTSLEHIDLKTLRLADLQLSFKDHPLDLISEKSGAPRWSLKEHTNGRFKELRLVEEVSLGADHLFGVVLETTPSLAVEEGALHAKVEKVNEEQEKINQDSGGKAVARSYKEGFTDDDLQRYSNEYEGDVAAATQQWKTKMKKNDKEAAEHQKKLKSRVEGHLANLREVVLLSREVRAIRRDLDVTAATVQIKMQAIKAPEDPPNGRAVHRKEFFDLMRFRTGK